MKKLAALISVIMYSSYAYAAGTDSLTIPMKEALRHSATGIPSITHVLVSTAIMVVMIYAVAMIYQKLNAFNTKKFSNSEEKAFIPNKMKIINSLALGTNKAVYIVEVNDKYLVLGSTQSNISLIKEFDKSQINKIIESSAITNVGNVVPEIIQQELKTLFPNESKIIETEVEKNTTLQETKQDKEFEDIYRKYI